MQPVGQYKVKTKMFLAVLSDKPQCCGEGNIFETKLIICRHLFTIKQKQLAPPKYFPFFSLWYQATFQCGPYNVKMFSKFQAEIEIQALHVSSLQSPWFSIELEFYKDDCELSQFKLMASTMKLHSCTVESYLEVLKKKQCPARNIEKQKITKCIFRLVSADNLLTQVTSAQIG